MSWPTEKLGNLVTIKGGGTPSKKVKEYWNGDIPWASVKDLKSRLLLSTEDSITSLGVEKSATNIIPKGTIIVPTRMALGKVAIAALDLAINQDLKALFVIDEKVLDKAYFSRFLESRAKYIESEGKGATVKGITLDFLKGLDVPLPPLEEQKRIAAILDKADAIRQKRKQAIDLADEFLRSVFLDMFGDPVTNPKGWEQVPLSTLSDKILNGTTPKGGSDVYVEKGVAFLRSQNVWKKSIELDDIVYLDDETHAKMSKSSLKHKDILITKTGRINTENSSLGRAAIYYGKDDEANINGHVYLVRLKSDNVHEFIEFILTTKEYRDHIRSVCVGGIDKRQLNKNHIEEFPIICPPSNEQQRFVKILHQSQKVLDNYKEQLVEAQNNFSALTQKAFLGQL
jgi:type I restriction enzyme S subunit